MGNPRVNTPLITINAMVRVGPWLVERVTHGEWRKCDRCGTDHKEVWTCSVVQGEEEVLARLPGGQRTWLVGSTCGPILELASGATWKDQAPDLRRIVRLAVDATRALERARAAGLEHIWLPSIAERLEPLKRMELDRHSQKVLRHHVNWLKNDLDVLERRARRQARPHSDPPSA